MGEYGVHWNFFFTLAGVVMLASMINIRPKYCGMFGLLILGGKYSINAFKDVVQ